MTNFKFRNIFAKTEERPTPPEVYNWRIYGTAIVASTASVLIGYDTGFVGACFTNTHFLANFGLVPNTGSTDTTVSNLISCFHAAAFFGALLSYPLSHYYGRKVALIVAAGLATVGAAVMLAGVTGSLAPIYVGRVFTGLTVGASTNLTVVYLSEVSPAPIRGQIIAAFEIGWRVGDLVGFWINYGINQHVPPGNKQWIIPVGVQLIPAGLFFAGSFVMLESPRWLFQVNRDEEAIRNLCFLRNLPVENGYMVWEINSIRDSIETQNAQIGPGMLDPAKEVFVRNRKYARRLVISAMLLVIPNFMGIQSINYYSPKIFANIGVKGTNATLFSSGMFGVVKFICTFIYILFIVDNFGRRKAFLLSASVCSLCFWYLGAYLKINDPTKAGNVAGPGGKAAIGFMFIWTASFILAWSGGPFVWSSEVFEQNIRTFVQAINAAMSWVPIFIMTRLTTTMIDKMQYGIFFFFAAVAALAVPFVFFLVPETKGIALEDMDGLFTKGVPAYRAHKRVMEKAAETVIEEQTSQQLFDDRQSSKKAETKYVEDAGANQRSGREELRV
ncbi:LAME_0H17238g1_1 [Lachancea meyersii CBS 8951]|uniref:Quinate transporter n=1 Tax=Lachancea meyersii CBS 8951 TaxID=1266667 RepID=A0A1G4KIG0_9SACH|nr:LAME_0H17238g1_1 [Lachancea meyersii CBS 8951]